MCPLSAMAHVQHTLQKLNIILNRFVSDDWKIEQRLVKLLFVAKSMTGEELAQQLLPCLSTNLVINSALLAAMRDRASVTDVAIRTLKVLYPNLVDRRCFSHTLGHVGEKMETPIFVSVFEGLDKSFCSQFKKQNCIQNTNRTKPQNPLSY